MPRGVYARKKVKSTKGGRKLIAAAKQAVVFARTGKGGRIVKPRRRNNPGVVDIPTISASALRSSISDTPTDNGSALVSKVGNMAAGFSGDKMLEADKIRYVVVNDDFEIVDGDSYPSMEAAVLAAKDAGKEHMEDTDRDDSDHYVYQMVAKVECMKPTQVETVVSVVGSSPA